MCERSPLFLPEAKSIIFDLLKRTLELFDLSLHLVEYYRLNKYLSARKQSRDYRHFSLHKPCKLNYTIISDLDTYLHRLYTTCRLTKSHLRSLHAARIKSSNDYIVIDDEIYELSHFFQLKINKLWNKFQSTKKEKPSDQIINQRYHSQRTIQPFVILPEPSLEKNNSQTTISEDHHQILTSFRKICQLYQFLIQQLYGIHIVRDSHILQPVVISIIRLLLFITNKLKQNLQVISPTKINRNHYHIQQHEEICHVPEEIFKRKKVSKFRLIEIHSSSDNQNLTEDVRNDNHSLDFDEDEFYRLANLERDD
jgi:hypothetical protein